MKLPLIDWTDEDISEYIDKYNVPLSRAYTVYGLDRTGCAGCPFSQHLEKGLYALRLYEPNMYRAMIHWLGNVYIAQGVKLWFDEEYMLAYKIIWYFFYSEMRYEMMKKYRPERSYKYETEQLTLF